MYLEQPIHELCCSKNVLIENRCYHTMLEANRSNVFAIDNGYIKQTVF